MFNYIKKDPPANSEQPAENAPLMAPIKDTSPLALRELLEKNLKWSQIIYEQNRKIKNALVWKAVASWMWFIVLVVLPTVGTFWIYQNRELYRKDFEQTLGKIMQQFFENEKAASSSQINDMIKNLLPLNAAQKEQFDSMTQKR